MKWIGCCVRVIKLRNPFISSVKQSRMVGCCGSFGSFGFMIKGGSVRRDAGALYKTALLDQIKNAPFFFKTEALIVRVGRGQSWDPFLDPNAGLFYR